MAVTGMAVDGSGSTESEGDAGGGQSRGSTEQGQLLSEAALLDPHLGGAGHRRPTETLQADRHALREDRRQVSQIGRVRLNS
jgi:hypothetical protein